MTMDAPEPYFEGVEDMATSEVSFSRESSFSQGDYIIKTAYASTDVSSSNFENTINEVELTEIRARINIKYKRRDTLRRKFA